MPTLYRDILPAVVYATPVVYTKLIVVSLSDIGMPKGMMKFAVYVGLLAFTAGSHALPPAPQGPYQSLEDDFLRLQSDQPVTQPVMPLTQPGSGNVIAVPRHVPQTGTDAWQPYNTPYPQPATP